MKYILLLSLIFSSFSFASEEIPRLKVIKLAENVYQFTSYKRVESWGMVGGNGLIVINGSDAHLIDTPWTIDGTKELIKWIESKKLTLKSTVVTHFHEDASGGISLLNNLQIKTYATSLTNKLLDLKKSEKSNQVITTNTYEVVPNNVEVFYPGAGHTEDNVVVWLPQSKILFGGCFVKSIHSKTLGNTADASIEEWPQSIQKVIDKYAGIETVVPGHGKAGDVSLLRHTSKLATEKMSL